MCSRQCVNTWSTAYVRVHVKPCADGVVAQLPVVPTERAASPQPLIRDREPVESNAGRNVVIPNSVADRTAPPSPHLGPFRGRHGAMSTTTVDVIVGSSLAVATPVPGGGSKASLLTLPSAGCWAITYVDPTMTSTVVVDIAP